MRRRLRTFEFSTDTEFDLPSHSIRPCNAPSVVSVRSGCNECVRFFVGQRGSKAGAGWQFAGHALLQPLAAEATLEHDQLSDREWRHLLLPSHHAASLSFPTRPSSSQRNPIAHLRRSLLSRTSVSCGLISASGTCSGNLSRECWAAALFCRVWTWIFDRDGT